MGMWRWIAAAALLAFATTAQSTDLSDLWWNANENGWGVNVAQQDNILFLTFFIYSANGQAYWLSGSSTQYVGTAGDGGLIYSGPLSQTNGPWYGGSSFNSTEVSNVQVGTVTFTASTVASATLTYNVGGTSVTKQLTRLTFRANPAMDGNYYGGTVSDVAGCPAQSGNGHFESPALIAIAGNTSQQIVLQGDGGTCTMSGPYVQEGRMGRIRGNVTCTSGATGSVDVFEMEGNVSGVTARFRATYGNGCTEIGHFGGTRR